MILGSHSIANPVQIALMPFSIVASNMTLGGVKAQKILRIWGSDIFPAGDPIRGFRFRILWAGLSKAELDKLKVAFAEASVGYVHISAKDLGVNFGGVAGSYKVTVDPQDPALKINWQQAVMPAEQNVPQPPVAFDVEAAFVGATLWDVEVGG